MEVLVVPLLFLLPFFLFPLVSAYGLSLYSKKAQLHTVSLSSRFIATLTQIVIFNVFIFILSPAIVYFFEKSILFKDHVLFINSFISFLIAGLIGTFLFRFFYKTTYRKALSISFISAFSFYICYVIVFESIFLYFDTFYTSDDTGTGG